MRQLAHCWRGVIPAVCAAQSGTRNGFWAKRGPRGAGVGTCGHGLKNDLRGGGVVVRACVPVGPCKSQSGCPRRSRVNGDKYFWEIVPNVELSQHTV